MSLTLDQRPLPPRAPRRLHLPLFGGVGAAALIGLWVGSLFFEAGPAVDLPVPASEPLWQVDQGLYRLTGDYGAARSMARLRRDGARQDILQIGEGLSDKTHARLVLHQAGAQDQPPGSFYLDITRMAALAGIAVTRSQLPQAVATRFGALDVAELTLMQGGVERTCAGLRLLVAEPDMRLTGFACLGPQRREAQTFACFIDRLELDGARATPVLAAFFAKAQMTPSSCVVSQTQVRNVERPSRIIPGTR